MLRSPPEPSPTVELTRSSPVPLPSSTVSPPDALVGTVAGPNTLPGHRRGSCSGFDAPEPGVVPWMKTHVRVRTSRPGDDTTASERHLSLGHQSTRRSSTHTGVELFTGSLGDPLRPTGDTKPQDGPLVTTRKGPPRSTSGLGRGPRRVLTDLRWDPESGHRPGHLRDCLWGVRDGPAPPLGPAVLGPADGEEGSSLLLPSTPDGPCPGPRLHGRRDRRHDPTGGT